MAEAPVGHDREFADYLRIVLRRRWIVIFTTAVVIAAAVGMSKLQTPVYRGTAQVLIQEQVTDPIFGSNSATAVDPVRLVQTQINVLESAPVREAVRSKLGTAPPVSATASGDSDIINVNADTTDARRSALVANTYATAFVEFRRTQAVNDLLATGRQIQAKIDDLQRQITTLDAQIAAAGVPSSATGDNLVAQRDSLLSEQSLFKQKAGQLQVSAGIQNGGAQLVSQASPPTTPIRPRLLRNGILALVAGLAFGLLLAFLFDHLDDSIKTKSDLSRAAPGLPVLGFIPAVQGWKRKDTPRVISMDQPASAAAEAYRSLRTSVQFLGIERSVKSIQVTSANTGDGKSTTAANLAVALSRTGERVIVACCDLRRPRIHEFFGLRNDVGLTSALIGNISVGDVLQEVPGEENLRLLASGPLPPNPSELLSSVRTEELFLKFQAEADILVIDSPPVLPVSDAAVIAGRVDVTLLVVGAAVTPRRSVARALEILRQVDARTAGIVLNGVAPQPLYGYNYDDYYYYRRVPFGRRQETANQSMYLSRAARRNRNSA